MTTDIDVDALLDEVIRNPDKFTELVKEKADKFGTRDDHYHRWVFGIPEDHVTVTLRLPREWNATLDKVAGKLNMKRSELIRWALYECFIAPGAS